MPQVFASPLLRRYYVPLMSSAYLFRILAAVVSILVPFIISYTIEPFWLTEDTYLEQPTVHFKHQMILMLEGAKPGSDIVWSTYDQLNAMLGKKFRVAEIQARESDVNMDGKADSVYITARVPLKAGEAVHHVRLISFFDYQLQGRVRLQMETAAYLDHVSVVPGAELSVWGTLDLRQQDILPQSSAVREVYNHSIITSTNGGIDSMQQVLFTTMLREYSQRNETTHYAADYPVWTAGAGTDFTLKMHIKIPAGQSIRYRPGVLQTIRYGTLQFLAIYIFVAAIVGAAVHFIFENQVFETRVKDDSRPKTHVH